MGSSFSKIFFLYIFNSNLNVVSFVTLHNVRVLDKEIALICGDAIPMLYNSSLF